MVVNVKVLQTLLFQCGSTFTNRHAKLQSTAFLYPTTEYFPRFLILKTFNSYAEAFCFTANYEDPTFRCRWSTYIRQCSENSACQHDANKGYAD